MKVLVEVKADKPDVFLAADIPNDDIYELVKSGAKVFDLETDPDSVDTSKKKFGFLVPIVALIPPGAEIAGAVILGVLGGGAALVGERVINWVWPDDYVDEPAPTK